MEIFIFIYSYFLSQIYCDGDKSVKWRKTSKWERKKWKNEKKDEK